MNDEYVCAKCKGVFGKITPENEALEELNKFFGNIPIEACDIVCDDCWKKIVPTLMEY